MSLAQTIAAGLRVADRLLGETIFYQRPGNDPVAIENVRRGNTRVEVIAGDVTTRGRVHDFLIEAVRLTVPEVTNPIPEAGDLIIVETVDRAGETVQQIYEVRPIAGGNPWQWHDPFQQWLRIHTQALAIE